MLKPARQSESPLSMASPSMFRPVVGAMVLLTILVVCAAQTSQPTPAQTYEELNKSIPMLGGKGEYGRLAAIIQRTLSPPAPTTAPAVVAPQAASAPAPKAVNGLAASVDYVDSDRWAGMQILVRFTNVSSGPLIVPIGSAESGSLELQGQAYRGAWKRLAGPFHIMAPKPVGEPGADTAEDPNSPANPVFLKLQPGQSAVLFLKGDEGEELIGVSKIKLVLRQDKPTAPKAWSGVVETHPVGRWTTKDDLSRRAGCLPFPAFFPDIRRGGFNFLNMDSWPPRVEELWQGNWVLIAALNLYDPAGLRAEFEQRMSAEADPFTRLFLATLAARAGSERAAMVLLQAAKSTDCEIMRNLHEALIMILVSCDENPPEWIAELALAVIQDQRWAIGLPKGPRYFQPFVYSTISSWTLHPVGLADCLARTHYRNALDPLIEIAKKRRDSAPLGALGYLGDKCAIPFLMEVVRSGVEPGRAEGERWSSQCRESAISSLGDLKATEAVRLLTGLEFNSLIIRTLERIGDPNAAPSLRGFIAARKAKAPGSLSDEDARSIKAAKLALVSLESGDRVAKYRALLADRSFEEYERSDMVWRMAKPGDANAIPILVETVKTDAEHCVVRQAVWALGFMKDARAVPGLIECFDVKYKDDEPSKSSMTSQEFREHIGAAMREITGQCICGDKRQWQQWWRERGQAASCLP